MKTITSKDLVWPTRKATSHKGQNGEVLIIGGSEDYVGSTALAGLAALRTGIDWISIAAPEKVAWAISSLSPDLITKKMPGAYLGMQHYTALMKLVDLHDAVLIGNGMGRRPDTVKLVKKLVKNISKPLVVDADAIKAIRLDDVNNAILTPHHKELALLLENTHIAYAQLHSRIRNNIIVEKGHVDKILSKDVTYHNKTGNPGMTVGGTGDVLAGLIVGFLAQGLGSLQSAINGAYINGALGDQLHKKKGYGFIASDLIKDYDELHKKLRGNL